MKKDNNFIGRYQLTTDFSTKNAGMCQWAFGERDGKEYFIKRLITPKYPEDTSELSQELLTSMKLQAIEFYKKRRRFYETIYIVNNGNIVAVEEFFREGSFFYLVSPRINASSVPISEIAAIDYKRKTVLINVILYSLIAVHSRGIVHSDLKPDNIIVNWTSRGFCAAKIIDFESGFFVNEVPEEIEGDQVYFSPEVLMRNDGDDVDITTKADIFALGILFHQYFCGELPKFNPDNISAGVALLNGEKLEINSSIPKGIADMLEKMLDIDPLKRPSAQMLWDYLNYGDYNYSGNNPKSKEPVVEAVVKSAVDLVSKPEEKLIFEPASEPYKEPVLEKPKDISNMWHSNSDDDL